jgi:two-component system chemotaxis sensor kinase CheA
MNVDMTMFHQAFFDEAADLLADLERNLLRLEESPEDAELLNTIFRCAHSIKGGSSTFGFTEIAHFTHGLETLLDRLRNGQIEVSRPLAQLLLESQDHLKALLDAARGVEASAPDSAPLIARIEAAIAGNGATGAETLANADHAGVTAERGPHGAGRRRLRLDFAPGAHVLQKGSDPLRLVGQFLDQVTQISVSCDASRLPALAEMNPEICYLTWQIEFQTGNEVAELLDVFEFVADESEIAVAPLEESEDPAPAPISSSDPAAGPVALKPASAPAAGRSEPSGKAETQTLRVSTDKVDKLINLVGELVINQSMLNEVVQNFTMARLPRLVEAVGEMERASRELQERVMAVRMLPIKHAFGRFPRLVHDLAAACGKQIELKMTGEETELDKTVIEMVADPLTHLVRNSIDHGLEIPPERVAAGKPEVGTISLNAFHEGGSIVIEVSDDGRGLNREGILKKAIERGLLSESDPAPSEESVYNYIFQPGFSTASVVTDLSGRGVGMDIVRKAVQSLGGSIALTSAAGKGTRFRIRLPLTMAILEGLSLSVGEEVYILPLTSIVESVRPKPGDVRRVAGQAEVAIVRGDVLPILRLYEVFGARPKITDPARALLVIVATESKKVALLVDELIGQSQIVIKSLETNYRKVEGIAGATILGDGRVALIVDVPGLIRGANMGRARVAA